MKTKQKSFLVDYRILEAKSPYLIYYCPTKVQTDTPSKIIKLMPPDDKPKQNCRVTFSVHDVIHLRANVTSIKLSTHFLGPTVLIQA